MMFFTIAFFCTERYVFSTIKSISQVKLKINSFLDKSSTKFRHFRAYCTTNRHIILLFKIFQQYSPLFDKYLSTFCAAAAVAQQSIRKDTPVGVRQDGQRRILVGGCSDLCVAPGVTLCWSIIQIHTLYSCAPERCKPFASKCSGGNRKASG